MELAGDLFVSRILSRESVMEVGLWWCCGDTIDSKIESKTLRGEARSVCVCVCVTKLNMSDDRCHHQPVYMPPIELPSMLGIFNFTFFPLTLLSLLTPPDAVSQ